MCVRPDSPERVPSVDLELCSVVPVQLCRSRMAVLSLHSAAVLLTYGYLNPPGYGQEPAGARLRPDGGSLRS